MQANRQPVNSINAAQWLTLFSTDFCFPSNVVRQWRRYRHIFTQDNGSGIGASLLQQNLPYNFGTCNCVFTESERTGIVIFPKLSLKYQKEWTQTWGYERIYEATFPFASYFGRQILLHLWTAWLYSAYICYLSERYSAFRKTAKNDS
jgi:hypothetical protein